MQFDSWANSEPKKFWCVHKFEDGIKAGDWVHLGFVCTPTCSERVAVKIASK